MGRTHSYVVTRPYLCKTPAVPFLERLGSDCARHPLRVIAVWVLALATTVALAQSIGHVYSDNVNLTGTESDTGRVLLAADDPAPAATSARSWSTRTAARSQPSRPRCRRPSPTCRAYPM